MLRWYRSHAESEYAIPAIALYEIQAGAEATRTQNAMKAAEIESWVEALMRETTVLSLDAYAARETARLLQGKSKALFEDAMIAAVATVHGLTVATRNTRDFDRFGVNLVNPFLFGRL